jgi:WD40 repeat protein
VFGRMLGLAQLRGARLPLLRWRSEFVQAQAFAPPPPPVLSVAFSADGKAFASGGVGGTVRLWDLRTGAETATLKGHTRLVNSVAFTPGGKLLASGSEDRMVWLRDGPGNKSAEK